MAISVGIAQPRGGGAPETGLAGVAANLQNASLVSIDPAGRPQPALAERWTRSADGLTWRFYLRPRLTFHDGSPLTAAAVADYLQQPRTSAFDTPPGLRDIEAVEAPRAEELVVRLHRPSALLLHALALVQFRGGRNGEAGAGPFSVETRTPGLIAMRAFPGYYRGRPQIDLVRLRSYETQRTAWGAMMRGEVDVLYEVAPEAVEFLQPGADVRAFSFLRPYVYFLGFNLAHPVLGRKVVRTALNRAVDRQEVILRALGGRGVVATGHVSPKHWAYDATITGPAFDPVAAMAELEAAALRLPTAQAAAADVGPSRFRFTALVPADYPLLERIALVVQKQLGEVGVDMALEPVPVREFGRRLAEGRFDAYVQEMAGGQGLNWPYWFWHSSMGDTAWVRSGYAAADGPLDRLRAALTDEEQRAAVRAFQEVIVADPPGIFLCWGEAFRAVRQRFVVPPERDRDIMGTLSQWTTSGADQP